MTDFFLILRSGSIAFLASNLFGKMEEYITSSVTYWPTCVYMSSLHVLLAFIWSLCIYVFLYVIVLDALLLFILLSIIYFSCLRVSCIYCFCSCHCSKLIVFVWMPYMYDLWLFYCLTFFFCVCVFCILNRYKTFTTHGFSIQASVISREYSIIK